MSETPDIATENLSSSTVSQIAPSVNGEVCRATVRGWKVR